MQIEYHTKGVAISRTLETWLEKRLRKFTRFDASARVEVFLRRNHDKGPVEADLLLHTRWGLIQSKNNGYDERTALAKALAKVEEQIRRFKEKKIERRRRMTVDALQEYKQAMMQSSAEPLPSRLPLQALPLMTLEEAQAMLNDRDHDFVIFRDMENEDRLTVLFRDRDGRIYLVQSPE